MAAQICERNCARFGVTLNWTKGKSEVTITYRGPGSSEARQKVIIEMESKIPFQGVGGAKTIIVVQKYKHFGHSV